MITILISGTPGTGKTSVSEAIAKKINAKVINLSLFARKESLVSDYDKERDTWVINEEKLRNKTLKLIRNSKKEGIEVLIIESHFTDIIPEKPIDFVIILRCEPEILSQRLRMRGYSEKKIIENTQSEILGSSANFFIQKKFKPPLFEIDTSKLSINQLRDEIIKIYHDNEYGEIYELGKIDWLEKLFKSNDLMKYFD